jgi:hypothetical protein
VGVTAFGEIFRLAPPAAGDTKWKFNVLHAFQGGADGQFPYSTPWIGQDQAIYGTAEGTAGEAGFFPGVAWRVGR